MNIIIIIVICLPHLQLDNHRRGESLVQLDHHLRCLHPSRWFAARVMEVENNWAEIGLDSGEEGVVVAAKLLEF